MNIFLKTCPECARAVPVEATQCPCDYRFHGHPAAPSEPTIEQIAREAQLYAEYLRARADQAAQAAQAAASDPNDRVRATAHDLGREAAMARAELAIQMARAARFARLASRPYPTLADRQQKTGS